MMTILFSGCEDDPLPQGIDSSVSGNVSDTWNSTPFVNLKLKVAEYKKHPSSINTSYEFIKWVDSSYTDSNGDYNFSFTTSGQGDHYRLHVEETPDIWTYYYDALEIENIGGSNLRDLDFLHLYPTNLIITLNNLEYTPIRIDVETFSDLENILIANGQVQRLFYSNKNTNDEITFRMKNSNDEYLNYTIVIPASQTTDLQNYEIILNNSDFN